jgi:multiple sugar transport system substrate-binding protein
MAMPPSHDERNAAMNRRGSRLLGVTGMIAVGGLLTGCAGFGGGGGGGGEAGDETLTFTTWASESEEIAFTQLAEDFEASHEGASIELNVVPYEGMFTNIDSQLASGEAPDIFRVDYGNLGVYSSQEQLLDLSSYFTDDEIEGFTPAFWEAVSFEGVPYGVPHQTDVSAVLINTALYESAGLSAADIPTTQADAWTWDEFAAVADQLRAGLPADKYPFVYNWQLGGTPRWLSWLFQAGGSLLDADGASAIESPEAEKALDFTKSFFENQWVPPTSSVKASVYADNVFTEQTTAMAFVGSFLVPDQEALNEFEWVAAPMPVDERGATDLGGNALVATAGTDNPDLAAEFLKFMVEAENMSSFCAATNELPTRADIDPAGIEFAVRPDVMPVFVEQATTIAPEDVPQLTSPYLAEISVAMQDQLEAAFVSGQSTADTLANIAAAVTEATS